LPLGTVTLAALVDRGDSSVAEHPEPVKRAKTIVMTSTDTREFTHPDVLTIGVTEGWADPETDPTRIDWAARQARAIIPFQVVGGRPINPAAPTGIRYGRDEMGDWGENLAADAVVTIRDTAGHRWLLMVKREDGRGWALPGGHRVRVRHSGNGVLLEPIASDVDAWFAELDRFADVPLFDDGRDQPPTPVGEDIFE
jgi:virulence-associated protein VagC